MRIALVSPYDYPYPGGVTVHIERLKENFERAGHYVRVIAPSSGDKEEMSRQGVYVVGRTVPVPSGGSTARIGIGLSPRVSRQVKTILEQEQFEVVHLHEPLLPVVPLTVLRFSHAVNIGTFHAYHGEKSRGYFYTQRLLRRWFRKLDGKIAVSRPAERFVSQYFPGYYNIIPNGADVAHFGAEHAPFERFTDGKLNILFVGRIEKRKGLRYLIEAYARVKREVPQSRLIIVGPESRHRKKYQESVQKSGMQDVVFSGYASYEDLPRYYHSADVFCSPATEHESFGIILLEAMAAGRPIVASNIQGYASVLTPGQEGLLVEPKDGEALAGALIRLLRDADLRAQMGSRGRITAQEYSWEQVSARVLAYYQRILQEKRAPGGDG